jgi:hypothetical protein
MAYVVTYMRYQPTIPPYLVLQHSGFLSSVLHVGGMLDTALGKCGILVEWVPVGLAWKRGGKGQCGNH